jgi:hypothetical protein
MDPDDPLLEKPLIDHLVAAQQYDKTIRVMEKRLKSFA